MNASDQVNTHDLVPLQARNRGNGRSLIWQSVPDCVDDPACLVIARNSCWDRYEFVGVGQLIRLVAVPLREHINMYINYKR